MRSFLVLFSFLIGLSGVRADLTSSSRIAAVVNNTIITQLDLMNRIRFALMSAGLEPTPENIEQIKPQMLRVMIDEHLQLQMGKKYGIEISENHVQAAISDIEQNNGMPPGAISQMMRTNNIPFKTLEDQVKAQLTWLIFIREKYPLKTLEEQVGTKQAQELTPSLQIADWEIAREMEIQKEKETKTQYHLAEILLPFDRPDQEEEVKNNLNKLIEELQKGAHFSALAQQFSGSATAAQGGDMGWLTEEQIEPEIKEHLSHMQPGQLSNPIRTSQGFVIIAFIEQKLPGSEGTTLLTMQQVLLPFPSGVTEDKAREIMMKAGEISRKAKSCPDLESITKKAFPSASSHLSQSEPLSGFPEALQKVINSLTINETSEPLLTQDGALLVMVCDKKTQKAEEFTKEDAKILIANRKHFLLARRELRDIRRQAFIDIRI